jgi:small subunit ribosomal protein S7
MRRGSPEQRIVPPDLRYNNVNLQTMILHIMTRGKKSLATRLVYQTLDLIQEKTQKNPIEVFDTALKNVSPAMEVRPRRVGGATYQVPMEVPYDRRVTLAFRWILDAARERSGKSFPEKLAMRPARLAARSVNAMKLTRWRRPTAPSPITASNF